MCFKLCYYESYRYPTYTSTLNCLFNHETTPENDGRLVDVMMLVTGLVVYVSNELPKNASGIDYLKVPTPPASRINDVSANGFPVQRMAKARRICPCATMRTSPLGFDFGSSKHRRWNLSLISAMTASRRRTTSSGDLFGGNDRN